MLQYILTALAGIAIGIVVMRIWQSRSSGAPESDAAPGAATEPADGAPSAATGFITPNRVLIAAGAMAAASIAVVALRSPDAPATPGSVSMAASGGAAAQQIGDVDSMINRLAERLKQNPNDGEGFRMLGWSYLMTGHPEKAIEPYKQALRLLPGKANVLAGYGEALAATANNRVTDDAKSAFDRAIAIEPGEPRARYFLALWQAQHGQEREALDKWIVLANEGPADAAWLPELRKQITDTSAKLGIDVSSQLKSQPAAAAVAAGPMVDGAAVQAAQQLPPNQRQAMIDGMVESLATKLKANPKDADGWIRLMRSRMVLDQGEQAARDLGSAKAAFRGDADTLKKLDAAAAALSVPAAR